MNGLGDLARRAAGIVRWLTDRLEAAPRAGEEKRQRQRQRTGVSALHEKTRKCPGFLRISGTLLSP